MKEKLMDILCCPVCKKELSLNITEHDAEEIIQGTLYCKTCDFTYPIQDGIPNLLPPDYHDTSN
jgi:uncharacterized protein YbaR (Trm112 family)